MRAVTGWPFWIWKSYPFRSLSRSKVTLRPTIARVDTSSVLGHTFPRSLGWGALLCTSGIQRYRGGMQDAGAVLLLQHVLRTTAPETIVQHLAYTG